MPLPPAIGFLGMAKEATPGTGVVPTFYLPISQARQGYDVLMQLDDTGMRGSMVDGPYDQVPGPLYGMFDIPDSPVFADAFGWAAAGILGDVATIGASDPFTHAMSLKNSTDGQPTSYSLTDYYGITGTNSRRYAGSKWSEVTLKWSADGLLTWSGKLVSLAGALVAKPTPAFTVVTATPAWECTANIGGSGNVLVTGGEISLKRAGAQAIHTADGTQAPYKIWVGGLAVEGKLTFVAEDDAEYLRYLNHTKPIVSLSWSHVQAFARTVAIVMSSCNYKSAKANMGGDYMTWEADIQALPNSTDAGASGGLSPCKLSVLNALPSATYV